MSDQAEVLWLAGVQITKPAERGLALSLRVQLAGVGLLAVRGVSEELMHFQVGACLVGGRAGGWMGCISCGFWHKGRPVTTPETGGAVRAEAVQLVVQLLWLRCCCFCCWLLVLCRCCVAMTVMPPLLLLLLLQQNADRLLLASCRVDSMHPATAVVFKLGPVLAGGQAGAGGEAGGH